jgi:hypothetical protein
MCRAPLIYEIRIAFEGWARQLRSPGHFFGVVQRQKLNVEPQAWIGLQGAYW